MATKAQRIDDRITIINLRRRKKKKTKKLVTIFPIIARLQQRFAMWMGITYEILNQFNEGCQTCKVSTNVNFHFNIQIKTYLSPLISKTKPVMCYYKCTRHQTILQINYFHRICPQLDGWALNTGEDCKTGSIFSTLTTVLWLSFAAECSPEWTQRCDGG